MTESPVKPLDLSLLIARIDTLGITWAQFVAWSGDPRASADHSPPDWQRFIAGHVFGCVRVSKVDAEALLADIAGTPERVNPGSTAPVDRSR